MTASPGPESPSQSVIDLVAGAVEDANPRGIAAAVHRLIRAGELRSGERLPTVRELAAALHVSPATVSEAWQALGAVGAIVARGRAGSFVKDVVEPSRPVRYLGIGGAPNSDGLDLSTGTPDADLLPSLKEALERVTTRSSSWTTSYLDDPVIPSLEEVLLRTWPFQPARITVVDGALDALSRIVDQVVSLGDRVVMESPGFPPLIDLLERSGAEIISVELDEQGVIPASLDAALAHAPVAFFLQPRAQNPTGTSMTKYRASELAHVLAPSRALIIEDDHSGEIAMADDVSIGQFLPLRTVHIRSYSKSHGPDLRIAAIGGSADVIDPLTARRMLGPGWTSRLLQAVLVELLSDAAAIDQVQTARRTYSQRSARFREALKDLGVSCSPGDGINVWVPVEDERSALVTLAAAGVRVAPGGPFVIDSASPGAVRITCGLLPDDEVPLAQAAESVARAVGAQSVLRSV